MSDDTPEFRTAAGRDTARLLLDIKAVNFRPEEPYRLTAGWASPVYIDCRWVISFLDARRRIVELGTELLVRRGVAERTDMVAGGETAGIPYGAWLSETLSKPMLYVRKQPKGFGRNARIEGHLEPGRRVLLVEDLATDGGSKINFVDALRTAEAEVRDIFVVFFYGAFPNALDTLEQSGVSLHYLCTWADVLAAAEEGSDFPPAAIDGVKAFLADPVGWSEAHGGRGAA